MRVTILEVLELESFREVKVVAGSKGLSKTVENIYVMEVPDITSYIDREGLLFTTLFPIKDNKEAMKNFIPELSNNGLAGVAIKLGRYIDNIPDYMVKQAEELSFPILLLPMTANFSLLTNEFLTKLLGMKTKQLEFRENISNKLQNLLLSGANIKDLVSYVSQLTHMDVLIVNNQLKLVESSLENDLESIDFFEKEFLKSVSRYSEPHSIAVNCLAINGIKYSEKNLDIRSINAGDQKLGYLIVLKNKKDEISYLNIVIEQAIILLAFLLQNQQSLIQKERNYLDNFISSMINTQYTSQTELIQKAKVFNWDIHFPSVILLIDIKNSNEKIRLNNYYKVLDSGVITETIVNVCGIPRDNIKTTLYNNQIICFVSVALIHELSTKLKRASEIFIEPLKKFGLVSVSISRKILSMLEIPRAYKETCLSQKVFKDVYSGENFIKFYKDVGVFKLFHLIEDKEYLNEYIEGILGTIIRYDQNNDMNLINTLHTLINNNMNMKKSSEDLYIHYNTLRYRVNKLDELGLNLSTGSETTEIAVALQLMKYLNYKN